MEREKLEGLLIDYIDGKLTAPEREEVERELNSNEEARRVHEQLKEVLTAMDRSAEWEPKKNMQEEFDRVLKTELSAKNKQVFFHPVLFRAAAAVVLVMAGIGIGYWINRNQQHEEELQAIKKEVEATKQMMMAMLDNRQSASQRMQGATVAFTMEKPDDQIVAVLARTMNEDPNTNVRLAALEALGKFHHQEHVRKLLIASLSTQKDPVIQIALIRLMVEMKEKDVMEDLRRMSKDDNLLPAVKDEAHAGILKLS